MEKALEYFADQLNCLHFGNINPSLIDTIKVDYYGSQTPIKYLATTTANDDRVSIVLHDSSLLGIIDKTLKTNGFNSYVFSKTTVVVGIPKFGIGAKEKIIAQIKKLEEETKIAIRNIRKKFDRK